jgi:hypothetical protein
MGIKRPDQLPSGQNFDFDDILVVETNPNSENRSLKKATLREFVKSSTKFDPEKAGENPLLGLQSMFEWTVEQLESLAQDGVIPITSFQDYQSETKSLEFQYITPTPTASVPISTMPTPTPTPTPSNAIVYPSEVQTTFQGELFSLIELPNELLPSNRGYSNWEIKGGQHTDNLYYNFFGYFPDDFQPSPIGEQLVHLAKKENSHQIIAVTKKVEFEDDIEINSFEGGLKPNSSLTITIKYS